MLVLSEFATRLSLAFLLGASIGIERQRRQKSAGLRTNTLVSVGAAAFILISVSITGTTGDPSRVAAQIVTGIGFLGAGVIMKDGLSVQGLNTAATIWCSAAVGSLVGIGLFAEAGLTAFTVIIIHMALRPIEAQLNKNSFFPKNETAPSDYKIIINCKINVENHIRVLLMQQFGNHEKILLRALSSTDNEKNTYTTIVADIIAVGNQDYLMEQMVNRLTIEQSVKKVSWKFIVQQAEL